MRYAEALVALDALYAALPSVACQRLCQQSCGVIVMTRLEWVRIQRKLGYRPKGKPSLVCPMLKHGACSVHAIRPTICRLFGAMLDGRMICHYGCEPTHWLTSEAGHAWLRQVEALSRTVYPHDDATAQAHGLRPEQIAGAIQSAIAQGRASLGEPTG